MEEVHETAFVHQKNDYNCDSFIHCCADFHGALPSVQAETTANTAKAVKITNVGGDFPLLLDDQGYLWATSVSSRAYRKNLFPNRGNFVRMDNMNHVVSLSSRFALKDDGSVWAIEYDKSLDEDLDKWGIYTPRQIKQIPGLEHIEKIYSLPDSLFALDRDGKLWFSESVPFWSKFDDSPVAEQRPLLINGIDHVKDISGIQILKEDGSVWTWECQQSCDLSSPPVQIQGLDNIAKLTGYGLALKKDGTVWMWGSSVMATPKNEDPAKGAAPFQVEGLSDIVDLSLSPTAAIACWH